VLSAECWGVGEASGLSEAKPFSITASMEVLYENF